MPQPFGAAEVCDGASGLPVLIQDVGVLLRHLTRNAPQALERAFQARGTAAPGADAPPNAAMALGADVGAFLQTYADIAAHWGTPAISDGSASLGRSATRDWAWLVQARAFLLTQSRPVSLDSMLMTDALHCELARLSSRPNWIVRSWHWIVRAWLWLLTPLRALLSWRRPQRGTARAPDAKGIDQAAVVAGRVLAQHVRHVRFCTVVVTVVAVLASMYVFAGKTLLDDQRRQEAQLAAVSADIQRDIDLRRAEAPDRSIVNAIKSGTLIHDTSLHYCDQPFLDHNGVVRFASAAQAQNCSRLWGVNQAANQTTRAMRNWMVPVPDALAWIIGAGGANGAGTNGHGWLRRAWGGVFGTEIGGGELRVAVQVFRGNARRMSTVEALMLATREVCYEAEAGTVFTATPPPPTAVRVAQPSEAAPAPAAPPPAQAPQPGAPKPDEQTPAAAQATPPSAQCGAAGMDTIHSRASAIHFRARTGFARLGFEDAGYITGDDGYSPIRARILIEGASLYLLPVIFSLLGSLVALNRRLRNRIEDVSLGLSERARGNTSLVLGTAFGAIVSLLAEVLRSGYAVPGGAAPSATGVALGLWPLAFLAGYSVTHVFRMLDSAVDRVFGVAESPRRN